MIFRGNVVRDSKESPVLANAGPDAARTGTTNVLIENNYLGDGLTYGAGSGNFRSRGYGLNGGFHLGWCQNIPGQLDYDNIVYRFNSHAKDSGFILYGPGPGLCSDQTLGTILVHGNIGHRDQQWGCRRPVLYRYNVYFNSGTCDMTDRNVGANGTLPLYEDDTPTPGPHSYNLNDGITIADNLVPVFVGCPETDKFGILRPTAGFCTAGGHQREAGPAPRPTSRTRTAP